MKIPAAGRNGTGSAADHVYARLDTYSMAWCNSSERCETDGEGYAMQSQA
jgi:hypothetical protein